MRDPKEAAVAASGSPPPTLAQPTPPEVNKP